MITKKKYQEKCEKNRNNIIQRWKKEEDTNVYERIRTYKVVSKKIRSYDLVSFPHISYINNILLTNLFNNTNIEEIKKEYIRKKKRRKVTDETGSLVEITKKIIEHFNLKTQSKFRYSTKATQDKIKARLNEGYVLDDFIVVIDKKCDEWQNTEFEMYLCPETLFGTKFEKYLNQKPRKKITNSDWMGKKIEKQEATKEDTRRIRKFI